MKNFIRKGIFAGFIAFSAMLTACTPQQSQPVQGPVVEIVERIDLLNLITPDRILPREKSRQLEKQGFTVSVRNLQLTGEKSVSFDMNLCAADGTVFTVPVNAVVSYAKETVNGKDVFSDVQVYWGDIRIYGEEAVITNLTRLTGINTKDASAPHTVIDLSGVMGAEGYILSAAAQQDSFAFLYHTPQEDGLAVFSSKGIMQAKTVLSTDGCHLLKSAESGGLPFDKNFTPGIVFTSGGDILATGQKSAWYYNTAEGILLSATQPLAHVEKGGTEYGLYCLTAQGEYTGTTDSRLYLFVKTVGGQYAKSFFFEGRHLLGSHQNRMDMEIHSGTPQLKVPAIGLEMDVDFSTGKVSPRYRISEDMLGERLYLSADRQYELYPMSSEGITHIALKEISTGKIRFISNLGRINSACDGETGFMSDGSVYILGDNDFCIYSTDMEALAPVWSLADYMPLGENLNTDKDSRILVSARRNEDGSVYAVYYDTLYYENPADGFAQGSRTLLKATYTIAHLDKDGNILAEYDTAMNALAGHCPVNIYLRSGKLNLTVTQANTDTVLTKGSLNIKDGTFTVTQPYKQQ